MARLNESVLTTLAQHDAMRGVFQDEERVASMIGPRPQFDPVHNHEHAKHARVVNQRHLLPELREPVTRLWEAARAKAGEPISTLSAKATAGFIVETLAGILTMYSAGVPFPEDVLFGIALAGLIFALVRFTSEGRGLVRLVALAVLILVALAVTSVRVDEVGVAPGSSPLSNYALPILLLVATFGVAVIAEPAIRKLVSIYPDWKRAGEATLRLGRAEAADRESQAFLDRNSRTQDEWDADRQRGIALYRSTHRATAAEIHGTDPTRGTA